MDGVEWFQILISNRRVNPEIQGAWVGYKRDILSMEIVPTFPAYGSSVQSFTTMSTAMYFIIIF